MIDTLAIKEKVLNLAICGALSEQNKTQESSEDLILQLKNEKDELIKAGELKKEKALPEIDEESQAFEIPTNWKWVRLGQICKQITDGTHKTPKYQKEGIPFLSVKNISSGFLDLSDIKYISREEHEELSKRCQPQRDDVLVCRIGTLGKALRVNTDIEFSVFVSLGLIKTGNKVLSEYICAVINSGFGSDWIQSVKAGGAMHAYKINLNDLSMMPIPLPPIEEQGRILDRINEIQKNIDIIDEMQAKYYKDIELFKNKLIDAGIRGKLTDHIKEDGTAEELFEQIQNEKKELVANKKMKKSKPLPDVTKEEIPFAIPQNWKWVRLGDLIRISSGTGLTSHQMIEGDIPVYGGNGIAGYHNKALVEEETIVIGRVGYYCGSVHVTPEKAWVTDNAFITEYPKEYIDRDYLVYALRNMDLRQNTNGAAQPVVSGKKIYPLLFALPPLAEQKRIAKRIDEILSAI